MAFPDRLVTNIEKCPRCAGSHAAVKLRRFDPAPADGYAWFGECPQTKQPFTAKVAFQVESR